MKALLARAERLARTQQMRVVERIVDDVSKRLRDADVRANGSHVVVHGKRLARRWLVDPALRFLSAVPR